LSTVIDHKLTACQHEDFRLPMPLYGAGAARMPGGFVVCGGNNQGEVNKKVLLRAICPFCT